MKRIVSILILLMLSVPAFGADVYYSVRPAGAGSGNDLKVACNISISSGTATFSNPQTGDIGVGCYVSSSNVSGYISEMTDSTHAKIITATGADHANVSSEALGAIYHPFASLSAAESGSGTLLGFTDLATNTTNLFWPCYGATADSTAIEIYGYTTDSTHIITAYVPQGGTESINDWRHEGKFSTNKARLDFGSTTDRLYVTDEYVVLDGLQITHNPTSLSAVMGLSRYGNMGTPNKIIIKNCIFYGGDSGGTYSQGINSTDADLNVEFINCIVHGCCNKYFGNIRLDCTTAKFYNCTISGGYAGIRRNSGTFVITNCAIFNNSSSDVYNMSGYATVTYTASDDNNISGTGNIQWTNGSTDWGNVFTDYDAGDFSLKNYTGTGALIDVGSTISGMTAVDIIGTSRPQGTSWDIGAFEYVSGGGGGTGSYSGRGIGRGIARGILR